MSVKNHKRNLKIFWDKWKRKQNMWGVAKAVVGKEFMSVNAYIEKEE